MIQLTVKRWPPDPPHQPYEVTARYDEKKGHWLCEDVDFYRVLRTLRLPDPLGYWPDEPLALVNYVASLYHGEVKDLRPPKILPPTPGVTD